MQLPIRIDASLPSEPVVSVDGAWGAPGLNLSHWPGNRTPGELRHDLSTGACLLFGALAESRKAELAGDCTAIWNNHYDTDGTASLFALARPEEALPRSAGLLAAARAGDFFENAGERAVAIDAIVSGLAGDQASPLAAELAGRSDRERWQLASLHLIEHLPAMLDGDLADYAALWEPVVERLARDVAQLERAVRDDLVHLDWTVWTAPPSAARDPEPFAPGRHALLGSKLADRVLVVAPKDGGWTYRLLLSTLSWFDLCTRGALPRPDLARLARRLGELEGADAAGAGPAWRAQPVESPSPELWFGGPDLSSFAEHAECLEPSALCPELVREVIADALREELARVL